MSRILVAYATKHRSTAEIAEAIAAELRSRGLDVDCVAAGEVKHVDDYNAVVIGSAVEKAMVRDTPEELRDARDWDQIRAWAGGIADAVAVAAEAVT